MQIPHYPATARTVIGVVGDVRQVELRSAAPSIFYLPMDLLHWCGLASYLPARRAARLDPQAALREA